MKKIEVGSVVAFNNLDDATWFKVEAIDGFILTVREVDTDYATQQIDSSVVKRIRDKPKADVRGKLESVVGI